MTNHEILFDVANRKVVRLLPAVLQNGITRRAMRFNIPVVAQRDYWCMGCGSTIHKGELYANGLSSGRLCRICVEASEIVDEPLIPLIRQEALHIKMDDIAAEEAESKVIILSVVLKNDVSHATAKLLARCWGIEISSTDGVEYTRYRTYRTVTT